MIIVLLVVVGLDVPDYVDDVSDDVSSKEITVAMIVCSFCFEKSITLNLCEQNSNRLCVVLCCVVVVCNARLVTRIQQIYKVPEFATNGCSCLTSQTCPNVF